MVQQRLFIRTDDIVRMEGCSQSNACRKLNQVRLSMGKGQKKPITIAEYCKYFDINLEVAQNFIFNQSPTTQTKTA